MKTPRVEDFDPNAPQDKKQPKLKSSMDDMPSIEKKIGSSQNASMPALQQTSKTAIQHASITARRHAVTPTIKMTFRFHPEGKYALEDIKTLLDRKHGIKTSGQEIAEEAILLVYEELRNDPSASKLATRLAGKTASQQTGNLSLDVNLIERHIINITKR